MSQELTITTGARLHFGLLSHRGTAGRNFGGVGLMVDQPRFRVALRRAESDAVAAPEYYRERIARSVAEFRAAGPPERRSPACTIDLLEQIPPHMGFGSGTQLGLAVAQGLALLAGEGDCDITILAKRVRRGTRSALGIHGFARGGFLVDGGKSQPDAIGTLSARAEFPSDWRMLLVSPEGRPGLAGAAELDAFRKLPGMDRSVCDHLCRIVLAELLPAVLEGEFEACGDALFDFGRIVGEYFAPVQGGVYADRAMGELVTALRKQGVRGIGQTSWGPTIFALCANEADAESLRNGLSAHPRWSDCRLRVAAPLNTGAAIEFGNGDAAGHMNQES